MPAAVGQTWRSALVTRWSLIGRLCSSRRRFGAQSGGPVVGDPVVEQFFELRVQRDVAVVVQLADRDPQPVGGADLHDRVDGEGEQLAAADAGAGEQFDDQPGQRVGVGAGGAQQLGRGGVVEEPWQRFVDDRQVAGEHQRPHRRGSGSPTR